MLGPAMAKADAGDTIVGAALIGLAIVMTLGLVGVPFMLWIGALLLIVAGVLMVRGDLGANATVGWLLVLAGPVVFILPGFFPMLSMTLPLVIALALWGLGGTKLFALW